MNSRTLMLLSLAAAITLALPSSAEEQADPGIFGVLDISKFQKPPVINHKPVVGDRSTKVTSSKAVYVHVPAGRAHRWPTLCRAYAACNVPVYFVTEEWFVGTYLPAIGGMDGREQRYQVQKRRERAEARDQHDVHGEE